MVTVWTATQRKPPAPATVFYKPDSVAKVEGRSFCHVCLGPGPMSREHVPPKAAFNSTDRRWQVLNLADDSGKQLREVPIRGGYSQKTLCVNCNTSICSVYAHEYANFTRYLDEAPTIHPQTGNGRLFSAPFRRLLIAKQIAVTILVIESGGFAKLSHRLRDFALDPRLRIRPDFRVFSYRVPKNPASWTIQRTQARIDFNYPDRFFFGGEVSLYPFGFVYIQKLGPSFRPDQLTEITAWFNEDDNGDPITLFERPGVLGSMADAAGYPRTSPQIDYL